jgi:hypothetical protein
MTPAAAPTTTSAAARTPAARQLGLGLARLTSQGCLPQLPQLVMGSGFTEAGPITACGHAGVIHQ